MKSLNYLFNLPKADAEQYVKDHENTSIGRAKDAGCYYGVQLESFGIVGIYVEEEDGTTTES